MVMRKALEIFGVTARLRWALRRRCVMCLAPLEFVRARPHPHPLVAEQRLLCSVMRDLLRHWSSDSSIRRPVLLVYWIR